ncbi:MAG: nitrilase-related carbon-nitrogen hydrolase, partial [Pseudomonadota bacterium]|nr:nitrilase-related carbon-nitrogen hydrolase [Pseudomonadota bacterium]
MVDEIKNKVNIALAQCNPTVGNVSGNFDLVLKARDYAVNEKADLVVFSELFLSGYPPEDLVLRNSFLEEITYYFEKLV